MHTHLHTATDSVISHSDSLYLAFLLAADNQAADNSAGAIISFLNARLPLNSSSDTNNMTFIFKNTSQLAAAFTSVLLCGWEYSVLDT